MLWGAIATFWLKRVTHGAEGEVLSVNVTFLSGFLLYFVAENIDIGIRVSGIMALVALGLTMNIFGRS